jgi:hypothetical protein
MSVILIKQLAMLSSYQWKYLLCQISSFWEKIYSLIIGFYVKLCSVVVAILDFTLRSKTQTLYRVMLHVTISLPLWFLGRRDIKLIKTVQKAS